MKSIQNYIDRLYDEWITHGKIIVAVDYDDTISPWRFADQEECNKVISLVKRVKASGAYIVIFTACAPDRYGEIKQYCETLGLHIDSINENPIELPYGLHKKVFANIFLDDRAGLAESMEILETAMYRKSGYDFQNNITEQNAM